MDFPITIEDQAAFDGLVKDRLAREREKYADHDDLRKQVDKSTKALEAANKRADEAEGKVSAFETEKQVGQWRADVAKSSGVPADALRGSTLEEFEAHAEVLKPFVTASAPIIPNQGVEPSSRPVDEERAFVRDLFGDGDN